MMISDLPKDLESEILSRVPAKSLWELKSTCKRWYALFRDRKFAEKNKKKLGESVKESMLLSDLRVYAIAGGDLLLQKNKNGSIEFTGKLTDLNGSNDLKINEIFHCDGLMLCSMTSKLVVWNPCTGQTRSIEPGTCCYSYDDAYALGYTTSSTGHRSYKILRRFYRQNDKKVLGEMYDLSSSGSWRVLDDTFPPLGYSVSPNGVSLKGDAYFVAPRDKVNDVFLITKFDFTTETLVRLSLPFQSLHPWDKAFLSVVRDEKIALLYVRKYEGDMSIWMTNKIDDEAKDLSWGNNFVMRIGCHKNNLYFGSFLFDQENRVAVLSCAEVGRKYFNRIFVADDSDKYRNKQVYEAKTSTFDWPRLISYAPSLVHIPKSTPKRRQKKQRLLAIP